MSFNNTEWKEHLDMLPQHCRPGVAAYIETGRPFGDFLTAVFNNDLSEAAIRADSTNQHCLVSYGQFLTWYAPDDCWGSRAKCKAWHEAGGLNGIEASKNIMAKGVEAPEHPGLVERGPPVNYGPGEPS